MSNQQTIMNITGYIENGLQFVSLVPIALSYNAIRRPSHTLTPERLEILREGYIKNLFNKGIISRRGQATLLDAANAYRAIVSRVHLGECSPEEYAIRINTEECFLAPNTFNADAHLLDASDIEQLETIAADARFTVQALEVYPLDKH